MAICAALLAWAMVFVANSQAAPRAGERRPRIVRYDPSTSLALRLRARSRGLKEQPVLEMNIHEIQRSERDREGFETVTLRSDRGDVEMRYYPTEAASAAAIFVGGAGGGFDTPVRGWLYPRLSAELQREGVAALRIRYRHPNDLPECVLDVLAGIAFLESAGVERVGLVGHSFGGAVVIQAAAMSKRVRTCVPMSTQTYGVEPALDLAPRCSLLLVHGQADEVLPPRCSEYVYSIAGEPKKLILHPTARHGLDEWSHELPGILRDWLKNELAAPAETAKRKAG